MDPQTAGACHGGRASPTSDLRRSFASPAVNVGVDIYQIKDLLGHSDVAVTQRAYAHLQQKTLRSASEVVAKTLGEARGGAM